jgi:hypothetical protein
LTGFSLESLGIVHIVELVKVKLPMLQLTRRELVVTTCAMGAVFALPGCTDKPQATDVDPIYRVPHSGLIITSGWASIDFFIIALSGDPMHEFDVNSHDRRKAIDQSWPPLRLRASGSLTS